MESHFFSIPDVFFGPDAISSLNRFTSKKVAIVTDEFMVTSGKTRYLINAMPTASVMIFGEVKPDPSIEVLTAGASLFKPFKPDAIIALGGGSSQDAAKGIKVTLEEYYGDHSIELVAIPTTSGSGSEVTSYAVISDPKNGRKHPLVSQDLVPDCAILDPQLVLSVPRHIAADTGMDVLTHAIEALLSPSANDFSNALAEKAVTLVSNYLPVVFNNETDIVAREHMHNASCMAGMAFNSSGLGLVHGMAHAIGGILHIPHGKINAMLLPLVIEFNGQSFNSDVLEKYATCAKLMNLTFSSPADAVTKLATAVRQLNEQLGIPLTLTALGKSRQDVENARVTIIQSALADGCTETNPIAPSYDDIDRLLTKVLG